jgi:hypothetical protein
MIDVAIIRFVVLLRNASLSLKAGGLGAVDRRLKGRRSPRRMRGWDWAARSDRTRRRSPPLAEGDILSDGELIAKLTIAEAIAAFALQQGRE